MAALTVLLVTTVLAVAGGVVAFSTTAELEIGSRDERAETAFAAAEGGLDVASAHFVQQPTWGEGQTEECLDNPLVPAAAGIECEIRITSPSNGQLFYPPTGRPFIEYTVVSKAIEGGSVVRNLASTYFLETADIPYGFFVDGDVDLNGGPKLWNESMLVNGNVTSRNSLDFDANKDGFGDNDPDLGWRFHKHRIQSDPDPYLCSDGAQMVGCAGVFSNFQIYSKNNLKIVDEIHFLSDDPAAQPSPGGFRNDRDVHQTRLDSNGEPLPVVTLPTDAVLEMMDVVKRIAEGQGLYFNYKNGVNETIVVQPQAGGPFDPAREFQKNVAVYIDADAGDLFKWRPNLIPGDTASDIKYTNDDDPPVRVGSLSGILVVRGGQLNFEAGTKWSGAVFVPENKFRILGDAECTCTIYAKGFTAQGGNATIQLTPAWFAWLPAGFATVTRTGFYECEPFQASGVCPAT